MEAGLEGLSRPLTHPYRIADSLCDHFPLITPHTFDNIGNTLVDAMSRKSVIMLGMLVGSVAGGYVPALLGADSFSLSLLGSTVGASLGIWMAYKIAR